MWGQLFILFVNYAVSIVLAPRPPKITPAALADIDVPTAVEGRPIPVVFGTVIVRGANVVWYGDLVAEGIKGPGNKKGR